MAKRRELEFADPSVRWRAGKASDFISAFTIKALVRVVLLCRVSHFQQEHNQNLADQEANLRRVVELCGGIVVGVVRHVGSGWDPFWIAEAVHLARQKRADVLLAETTDRLVRHPGFHPKRNPDAQARKCDLVWLSYWADGLELMTHLQPDASPSDVRSYQRRRGQNEKNRRGGRPRKKPTKVRGNYKSRPTDEDFSQLASMLKKGRSVRTVAWLFDRSASTIQSWIEQLRRRDSSYCTNS